MQLCLHGIAEYHHTVHKVAFLVSVFFFFFIFKKGVLRRQEVPLVLSPNARA